MHTYKNITEDTLIIPGVGMVAPGKTIESEEELRNVNLEEVTKKAELSKNQTQ